MSSCITTYKKTPPPVPPRTTTTTTTSTKPFISITAQSSTESAQDAYMEGSVGPRGGAGGGGGSGDGRVLHSGLSNSTESIDSMKALTAAIEAANAQIHGPASQHVSSSAVAFTLAVSSACTSATSSHAAIPALTIGTDAGPAITLASLPQLLPTAEETRREALRRSRCLSIGIQVRAGQTDRQGGGLIFVLL